MSTGFVLLIDEQQRADLLVESIEQDLRFSDALSIADWQIGERSIALIGLDSQHLHYAALARRGRRVATLKFHVEFTDFVDLQSLVLLELESELRSELRSHFVKGTSGHGHPLPQKTWHSTLTAIRQLRPSISQEIDRLEKLAENRGRELLNPRREQLAQEKDALLLARQIFALDPKQNPLNWISQDIEIPSFLAGVNAPRVTEDSLIQHDREIFGLWRLARRFQVGAAQFSRGREKLTVLTANRNSLEKTLGVDLIYWHHRYRSFTMVQYKRMVKERTGKGAIYRLSTGSYEEEIERMREIRHQTSPNETYPLCSEYRLSDNPFFFKLCHLSEFSPNDQSLIPGMYIPLDYWEILLASDGLTGPRGGKLVSHENVGRYLNNTEFIALVQSGWIGSCGVATGKLEKFIEQALNSGRAVDFAWSRDK